MTVKIEETALYDSQSNGSETALYDSQSNGLAESAVKDVKDAVRTKLAYLVRRFGREFPGGHPPWFVKYSAAMGNRCRRGPDGKTAYELRKGRKVARALPHFAGKILFMILGVTKSVSGVEPRWEDGIFLGVFDQSDELCVGTERLARGSNTQASRSGPWVVCQCALSYLLFVRSL